MNLDIQTLNDHGFLVLNDHLTEDKFETITANLQSVLSNLYPTELPKNADDAEKWVIAKTKLQRSKDILNLMNKDINHYLKTALNIEVEPVTACQITARFPLEGVEKKMWHIDNFTEKDLNRKFTPKEFDYLVGIYLTNNEEENHGNFTCFSGGHHQTRAYCRHMSDDENIVYEQLKTNSLTKIRSELKLSNEFQIKCKKGSVLIADRMLPHLISAPNLSNDIRIVIFFRTRLVNHELKNLLFGKVTKDTIANEVELNGLGFLKDKNIYRIKPRLAHHLPNTFASMVEIKYDDKLISIHSGGFLSKESHNKWFNKLKDYQLMNIIKHINDIDYKDLIEEFYPMQKPFGELESVLVKFHHIHSLSKSSIIQNWYEGIEVTRGTPGLIKFTVPKSISEVLLNRIMAFHWNKRPKIIINP